MSTGNNARKIRELKDLTQSYVAGKLGISVNAYSKIERDITTISVSRLYQLADVLEVPPALLVHFDCNELLSGLQFREEMQQLKSAIKILERSIKEILSSSR